MQDIDFKNRVKRKIGINNTIDDLSLSDCISDALGKLSKDKPLYVVADIDGDGTDKYDLPANWNGRLSKIISVEYPTGEDEPELLEAEDYFIYKEPDSENGGYLYSLNFIDDTPTAEEAIRITYTTNYSSVEDVDALDIDVFATLAASLACGVLARTYSGTKESNLDNDFVNFRGKGDIFASRAKELIKIYNEYVGIKDGVSAASSLGSWSTDSYWATH